MTAPTRLYRPSRRTLWLLLSAAAVFWSAATSSAADPPGPVAQRDLARQILDAAGVQGGLVVHLGCGDGKLTAALPAGASYLVHGLDVDPKSVEQARRHVEALGLGGPVSVDRFDGQHLPYIDNLVNLIVTRGKGQVTSEEIARVLAPGGVAVTLDSGLSTLVSFRKPWPDDIDQWTHYLHGPDNNAVARDRRISTPRHIQWVGQPKWARHHNHLASLSAMVSAGGRVFAIVDEGPIESLNQPPKWRLVARDAFNGVVLWKKAVDPWEGHLRPFRSGPPELSRRLVAVGDRVYVTLGYGKPLSCLDAATGRIIRTYDNTAGTVEVVCKDGILYIVVGSIDSAAYAASRKQRGASPPPRNKRILAILADTGQVVWAKSDQDTRDVFPTTLCVGNNRVFFHSPGHVICLEAESGTELWRTLRPARLARLGWSTPTLVAYQDIVLCADCDAPSTDDVQGDQSAHVQWNPTARPKRGDASLGSLIALSEKDGKQLWRCPTAQGYNAPADVFVADGLVWTSTVPNLTSADFTEGRDPRTGEVKRRLDTAAAFTTTHHHRCYRNKATDRFILLGRTGTEFIDLTGNESLRHNWFRGACQYGVMPSGGLIYAPPHSCACYIQSKLSGFLGPGAGEKLKNPESRVQG